VPASLRFSLLGLVLSLLPSALLLLPSLFFQLLYLFSELPVHLNTLVALQQLLWLPALLSQLLPAFRCNLFSDRTLIRCARFVGLLVYLTDQTIAGRFVNKDGQTKADKYQ
jgi:hypothetical protein